jgi:hypothetical protein
MARTYSLPTTRPVISLPAFREKTAATWAPGFRVAGSPALPNVARNRSVAEASRQACEERQIWRAANTDIWRPGMSCALARNAE